MFDPATGTQTAAWVSGHNIFCAGLAHLTDGTLFTAGGNLDRFSNGIVNTYTFNAESNSWTLGADMQCARWYPVGDAVDQRGDADHRRPPLDPRGPPNGRQHPNAVRADGAMDVPFYPWMDVAPDGRVFYSGPDDNLRKLDPAGDRNMAELRCARRWREPGLRQPRPL